MKTLSQLLSATMCLLALTACGHSDSLSANTASTLSPVDVVSDDDQSVVHGRAVYTVSSEQHSTLAKAMSELFIKAAHAHDTSDVSNITYDNGTSTHFKIDVSGFGPGAFEGNTLSLGSVAVSHISDNNLKVCGKHGNTQCSQAVIRVYTTGSVPGFVHTMDAYGVPIYSGTLHPKTPVGLHLVGSVPVQTANLSHTKRTISLTDFPSPHYPVTADFSNGGSGSYAMTYVVEYALLP